MNAAASAIRRWRERPDMMVRELFHVEPDAWQEEALRAFPTKPRIAMKACAGPGKAQPLDLEIDTPLGRRRWGDLHPGEPVFAENGRAALIKATIPQGIVPIYRVTFDDGCATRVCGDHLWKVRGRTERRHFKVRQGPNWNEDRERWSRAQGWPATPEDGYAVLSTTEILARNQCNDGMRRQFEIPRQGPIDLPRAALPLDPYVLGAWIGDGGRQTGRGSWRDPEIDDEVQRRGYRIGRNSDGTVVTVYGITGALRELDLFDKGSPDRFVPDRYKWASAAQREALLVGLMDTDGTIGADGSMSFDVTSPRLAEDVAWLVRSLGGVAGRVRAKDSSYRHPITREKIAGRTCYRVTVTLPFNPFFVRRKSLRWRAPQARYLTRYIDRIEPVGEAEAMCIEIDHPSGCYLTNDFIVTHNTAVLAWMGWNFLLTRGDPKTHDHPMIGATSITGDNLRSGLWPEFIRWRNRAPLLQQLFETTGKAIFAREAPETWRIEARTWAKDADADQIGNALRGVHAKFVMWLLDESGDYPNAIMPVCENIFSGEPREAHIVQAGNPTKLDGPLYRACVTARELWHVVEITGDPDDPKRSPRIPIEHAREQIAQYGRDNPWVMVNILGQFPPASLNSLIGPEEVRAAMNRLYSEDQIRNAPKVLGVDVAREGDDQSVVAKRQGLQVFPLIKHRNIDGIQGAGVVAREWGDWNADACFLDMTGGFGASWFDQLSQLNYAPISVQFSARAHQHDRYANKRTEMCFDLVEWIKRGGALPDDARLLAALTQTTYTFRGDRLLIEPKEQIKVKLGYSPDEMDAVMLTLAEPVSAPQRRRRVSANAMPADYDPFASLEHIVGDSYGPFGR